MERTKHKNKPSAILTSDWHVREDTPVSRVDDYWKAQADKIIFIRKLQEKYGCPILHAGDLFNYWKPSPGLLNWLIQEMPDQFYTIPGNHDLPQHSLDLFDRCGLAVMNSSNRVMAYTKPLMYDLSDDFLLYAVPWGMDVPKDWPDTSDKKPSVLMIHELAYKYDQPYPGAEASSEATILMRKYKAFDLILTGHNHQGFTLSKGKWLVNPGSLLRMTASQVEHEPSVYLWYAKTNELEQVKLPVKPNVLNREHIDIAEDRRERMAGFIERISEGVEIGLSFRQNMEKVLAQEKPHARIQELIWEAIDGRKA